MQLTSTWFDFKCLMRVRVGLELVINIVIFSIAGGGRIPKQIYVSFRWKQMRFNYYYTK